MTGFLTALYQTESQSRPQCIAGDRLITREELRKDASVLAASLPGEKRIAVHCQSAHLFSIALMAVWQRGSTVILPATDKPAYLCTIEDQFDLFLDDVKIESLVQTDQAIPANKSDQIPGAAHCFSVFFTSGSTGLPKPITKTLKQLESEVTIQDPLWSPMISAGARVIGLVSHQHIYGLIFRVIWPVMSGRVFTADPAPFWEMMQGDLKQGDVLITSPAHLKNLHPGLANVARPSLIFSSGGPLDHEYAQAAQAMFGTCPIEIYGSTETGGIAYRQQTSSQTDWTPLPGVTPRLDDKGCLAVQAPHIADANWYQTEDIAAIEPTSGNFRLLGRADRIVKIEGKRVSLSSVERHLIASDLVSDAVSLLPDENDRRLGAVVVLTDAGHNRHKELGAFRMGRLLRREIAKFEEDAALPQRWRFVDQIPTDSQGKRPLHLLRTVFAQKPTEPAILETIRTDEQVELKLQLNENLIYFAGHFPDMPILPGVTQLHWATSYASSIFGTLETPHEISQLKFRKPMLPGHIVKLEMRLDARGKKVKFRYFSDTDGDLSSGILKYGGNVA